MLSGPRWWAPKGRGPWCTAPLAPPVWPPLMSLHLNHKPDSASRVSLKIAELLVTSIGSANAMVSIRREVPPGELKQTFSSRRPRRYIAASGASVPL